MVRFAEPRQLDRRLAEVAQAQHGVVALGQLQALGLSARAAQKRAAVGRLHRLHRGVYAVGHDVLTVDGRGMAAVLAGGEGAVLSHVSAAKAWGILGGREGEWHVTVPHRSGGRRGGDGITIHHPRALHRADVTALRRVPITTAARTLVDLADVVAPRLLAHALHEAEVLRLADVRAIREAVERAPGRRGRAALAELLDGVAAPAPTRSVLENRFEQLCRDHRLPTPALNAHVEGFEVDALFASARLVVELDGAAVHHTRRAFERDRARDAALVAAGCVVIRITWRRLRDEPDAIAAQIRQILRTRQPVVPSGAPEVRS